MTAPFAPSTGSASISTTEFSLPSNSTTRVAQTTACRLVGNIDLSSMVAGDQYRIRVYDKVNGSAQLVLFEAWPTGAQTGAYVLPLRSVNEGWDVTLLLITGSARTVGWTLKLDVADVNVASLTAGAITAAAIATAAITAVKFATDAIDSTALAASAVTEIQTGLATSTALTTAQADLTTLTGRLTSTRAGLLDNLDAAITTRAAAATALSTAQWTNTRAGLQDNLDAAVSTRAAASTAVSNVDYTSARATKIDQLDAAVSTRAAAATALSTVQWTNTRAGLVDNLDATVSSRAASATALSTVQWTNGRAAALDSLDTTVSSRASSASVTAVGSAVLAVNADTDDIQSRLPAALDGSGNIKAAVQSVAGAAATTIADAVMASVVVAGFTVAGTLRTVLSFAVGKLSILSGIYRYRDPADTKDVIVGTVADTGRTSITVDPS